MKTILRYLGYAWASPVTLFGLIYAMIFWALRYYTWHGYKGVSLVWRVNNNRSPKWLSSLWKSWAGHTIGQVVIIKYDDTDPRWHEILTHEQEHVRQCMKLGFMQPVLYMIFSVSIWLACPNSNPYYSNPFEVDARRQAGEIVDVEGKLKK